MSAQDEAKCTSANGIYFENSLINEPYKCSPQDPDKKCMINFNIDDADNAFTSQSSRDKVEADCRCAMTDQTSGFCGSVIGTEFYRKAVRAKKLVLQRSDCHTLDRYDFRAQKDKCGIGRGNEEWRFAVDQSFNVTHWPYIHSSSSYHCV